MDVVITLAVLGLALYGVVVLVGRARGSEARSRARKKPAADERPDQPLPDHCEIVRLSSDGRVEVVGESHYQPAIRAGAQGRDCVGWENAVATTAVLVPEPQNRYDRNAVRVAVDGRTVGYLSREVAVQYQPQLLDLLHEGVLGSCPASICGGGDRYYGVFLRLGAPGCLVPLNSPAGLDVLVAERQVTVTGEEHHQGVLTEVAARGRGAARLPLYASLHRCAIGKGKHAGRVGLEVRVDGRRVGELTKLQADRYGGTVEAADERGAVAGCEARLMWSDKGWQVELMLPRVDSKAD